jgi:hypothetical protein
MTAPSIDLLARQPERLVVSGFRNIMAAYELADADCWEAVWRDFIAALGAPAARRLVGELQYWARCIRFNAERPLTYFPQCCLNLCHDECMALSIVAAAQAADAETGWRAARYLIGSRSERRLREVWTATLPFAAALREAELAMFPVSSDVVDSIFAMQHLARQHRNPTLN